MCSVPKVRPGFGPRPAPRIEAVLLAVSVAVVPSACSCSGSKAVIENTGELAGEPEVAPAEPEPAVAVGPVGKGSFREHPAQVAFVFDSGHSEGRVPIAEAEGRGLTVVDLGDEWVPFIFSDKTPGRDDLQENLYRSRYVDLAAERTDAAGTKLADHEHNYLELYGIPPTLGVVLRDFDRAVDEVEPCLASAGWDPAVFDRYRERYGTLAYERGDRGIDVKKGRWFRAELERTMKKARIDPAAADAFTLAAEHPKTRAIYKRYRQHQDRVDVVEHAQRRFRCERMFPGPKGLADVDAGVFDSPTTHALATFEKKHDIMGWGHFTPENLRMLAMAPARAEYERLVRVITERVVSAAGVVEDGSAARWRKDFEFRTGDGKQHRLRDLVGEMKSATLVALGLESFEDSRERLRALAALHATGEGGFSQLLVAVRLPELPEYYADDMKFEVTIDRGDVWYDPPFDDTGGKVTQPRQRYPHLTLYASYEGQRIPIVHWRTTIGSWRSEMKDGQVYLKYKNSDVGPRVWSAIVAGPVWIPPASTPPTDFMRRVYRDRQLAWDIDYGQIGPGYESAYGLVAAFHIRQIRDPEGQLLRELDNQIRTHGSVDYMSILRRYSHGCHRLYNREAVRMFSFILRHREYTRAGQDMIKFRRALDFEGEPFRLVIDTRGYRYELPEPIPVLVTEGRIRGRLKQPVEEYIRKPGVVYGEEEEELEVESSPDGLMTPDALPPQ